jgi:hypothetical protein
MGLQASIEITYSKELNLKDFLNLLFEKQWHYNDHDTITFLSNDEFDWENESLINYNVVLNLLNERFTDNKIIGIALLNNDNRGGLFHFLPDKKEIMILLNINRNKLSGSDLTNFSFYSERLLPVLNYVSEIKFTDVV